MLKVYFDNVLIDTESYTQLDNEYKLFTDNFKLGSTASNAFYLSVVKSAVSSHPSEVRIEDDTTTLNFIVDDITANDNVYTYVLVEKLVDFNFDYDASILINAKAELEEDCYLSDIWHDMCDKAGVEYDEDYIFENDIVVNWYDNRVQARRYLSYIAELQSGYACILENGKQSFKKQKRSSVKTIDADECSDLIIGEKKKITRVVYDGGAFKWEFGDETGDTLYLQKDNVFIVNEQIVENIYNNIKDFEFYTIDVPQAPMDSTIKAGDVITFDDNGTLYPTIAQYKMSYAGGWTGGYQLKVNTTKQQETQVTRAAENVKNIKVDVDRLSNEFSVVAEEIEKLTDYIKTVGTTDDYLKIPNTPKSNGAINKLNIKGFELMPLYPNMAYPSDYTYPGVLNFYTLIFSNELVTYSPELPIASEEYENMLFNVGGLDGKFYRCVENEWIEEINLSNVQMLYINSPIPLQKLGSVYDELLIEANKVKVIQRIGYDFDNEQWSVLSTPITHELNDVPLPTFDGDTYVSVKYFDNLIFNAEYLIKNDLTSNFATQLESSTQYRQNQNEIDIRAKKDELISLINLSPENAKIQAGKLAKIKAPQIELEGLTTVNNNFKVLLDGSIEAKNGNFQGNVTADNLYLNNGGRVISGDGLLTNLQFQSASGDTPLGWYYDGAYHNMAINIPYMIPNNFTIIKAYVTLYHIPTYSSLDEGGITNYYWCYSRNVKLYKISNTDFYLVKDSFSGVPFYGDLTNVTEIPNAFGPNGFTANVPNASTHDTQTVDSTDVYASFSSGESGMIIIKTSQSTPSSPSDALRKTGHAFATLNFVGYISVDE